MGEDNAVRTLRSLLELLVREESYLVELIALARSERDALVRSDFEELNALSERMLGVAGHLDICEEERSLLLEALGKPGATLRELEPLAAEAGVDGLPEARDRLLDHAERLRETQEQNARLILAAARMHERWFELLAGTTHAYDAAGATRRDNRRFISKSA